MTITSDGFSLVMADRTQRTVKSMIDGVNLDTSHLKSITAVKILKCLWSA